MKTLMAVALFAFALVPAHGQAPLPRTSLVIVVDGLRPDYVTRDVMPRLTRLAQRGIVFNAHHSVFPTVTRVNAASFVTGTYPETHGLLGNTIYVPSVDPAKGLDTGDRKNLEAVQIAERRLLSVPTLGELLQRSGRTLLAVSSGSTGSSFLLNHTVASGAILHTEYTLPERLGDRVSAVLGPAPAQATPNDPQNQRAVDAYLKVGLEEIRPDVTFMWLNDPDGTAHANGIGADITKTSLTLVDSAIGRIEDTLRAKGLLDRTNIIITSDHGFSTHRGGFNLEKAVEPFARVAADGSKDIVVAEGAIYLRGDGGEQRIRSIVAALQRRPDVGAIFTRPGPNGGAKGIVPGTLSFEVARWNHARSGDILVSANWTDQVNQAGFKGTTSDTGTAGHGSSSPFDIHNTLIAAGPDFLEQTSSDVPTGNVDLAPTLLHLLGLPVPPGMTGRVIQEGLREKPAPVLHVSHTTETATTADGTYELTAHISVVSGHRYLDDTVVKRK